MQIELERGIISYEIKGEGTPVLFIHGFPIDSSCMIDSMEHPFSKDQNRSWKRIYIDLPGMGKSPPSADISYSDHILEIVLEFIAEVIATESFLIVGYSYGGYLAQGVAHHMPNQLLGMFLLCPVLYANRPERDLEEHDNNNDDNDQDMINSFPTDQAVFLAKIWQNYRLSIEENLPLTFAKPALIMAGKDDSIVGYRDSEKIWRACSKEAKANFYGIEDAGHDLQFRHKELFRNLLKNWLINLK